MTPVFLFAKIIPVVKISNMLSTSFPFLALLTLASAAQAFELQVPVRCVIGNECFVQNYVDQSSGPDYLDYRCNKLTYDKHDGTDIRLPTATEMQRGVAVVAAADGTVLGVRDGMEDISIRKTGRAAIEGRECGNGVVLQHGDGYQTQYCHLKKGSIKVTKGQTVKAGDELGEIGLSGDTEFPHIHLSVRKDGKKIDPFSGNEMETGCGRQGASLWSATAKAALQYRPTSILKTGFTSAAPGMDGVLDGRYGATTLPADAPAMIFWALMIGLHPNDQLEMSLKSPTGEIMAEATQSVDRAKAQYFQFIGKKRKADAWPRGNYTATSNILRDGTTVTEKTTIFKVE